MNKQLQLNQFAELDYSEMQAIEGGESIDVLRWALFLFRYLVWFV